MSTAFTEDQIRPDALKAAQVERFAADLRRLLSHKAEFVSVACPACGGHDHRHAFDKYELVYVECTGCETVYMSPRPPPSVLEDYYANSENYAYWNQYIFPASAEVRRTKIFRPRAERVLEICRRYGVPTGTLLEVGSAFGLFCEELQRLGGFLRIIGVEPTPGLAQTCRDKGIETIEKPIEQVELDAKVDVVANFEVIEHLFSPREFLERCATFLAPGGLLVVTCPNIKGFDVAVLREASDVVDNEHLNDFHPASLTALVASCGFDVVEVTTPGELDAELVRKKALAGAFDLGAQPFLQELLLRRWEESGAAFQRFLAENRLSSHMWLVAQRR